MGFPHPWLMAAALALGAAAVRWLLRPPRRRVLVSHVGLWRQAVEQAGRAGRPRRRPVSLLLMAAGGLLVAASAGGLRTSSRAHSGPQLLFLVADTPHLSAVDAAGRVQRARLADRLAEAVSAIAPGPGSRAVVVSADRSRSWPVGPAGADLRDALDDWLASASPAAPPEVRGAIRAHARGGDAGTLLLGEFAGVPPAGEDVQWIFRPAAPRRDIAIVGGGAERVAGRIEVFAAVRRLAGGQTSTRIVVADPARPETPLAETVVTLDAAGRGRAILSLAGDHAGPIRLSLAEADDQPADDVFFLAPEHGEVRARVQVIGRPNAAISRAVAASERLAERAAGDATPADWLIVNEPAEPVAAGPGQWCAVIDPLVPPAGVRVVGVGRLTDATTASQSADRPWTFPLDGVTARSATAVALASPWQAVASDGAGRPMIAWNRPGRLLAVFFGVSADNSNWSGLASWPLFWDGLAELGGREESADRWGWRPGSRAGLRGSGQAAEAVNLPAAAFESASAGATAAVSESGIRRIVSAVRPGEQPIWPWTALAGAALLAAGWLGAARSAGAGGAAVAA